MIVINFRLYSDYGLVCSIMWFMQGDKIVEGIGGCYVMKF